MRAPPSTSSPSVQQAHALLAGAAGREAALGETLTLLERMAREASGRPADRGLAARLRAFGRVLTSRAAHADLSARLERLAVDVSRVALARQRLEVELREWDGWTAQLAEGRDRVTAAAEALQFEQGELLRRRREREAEVALTPAALAQAQAERDALLGKEREITEELEAVKAALRKLRSHAAAASSLQTALTRTRAQLQRLHAALSGEQAALEGNVAIRAQVARRQELARDVSAAVGTAGGTEDAAALARETLAFLTDASDLLRRHRAERERDL